MKRCLSGLLGIILLFFVMTIVYCLYCLFKIFVNKYIPFFEALIFLGICSGWTYGLNRYDKKSFEKEKDKNRSRFAPKEKKEPSNKELLSALFLAYIPAIITIYIGNVTELAYFISSAEKTKFTAEFFNSLNEVFNQRFFYKNLLIVSVTFIIFGAFFSFRTVTEYMKRKKEELEQ